MPDLQKLALLVVLIGATGWTQSGSAPAQADDVSRSPTQPSQPTSAAENKATADSVSNPPDSTTLMAIKTQKAIYPYAAREQKIQGEVMVKILVSEEGDVESAEAVSGHPILRTSAVDAVKRWKFKPFIKNGKPVKVSMKLPIDFAFSDKITENFSAAASGGSPKRVRVSNGVSQGLLLRKVDPVYPDDARRAHIQGTVLLQASINKEGRIADLRLIAGPKELVSAAIGAVQQWRYKPYPLMGNPVEVETQIQVNFQLR